MFLYGRVAMLNDRYYFIFLLFSRLHADEQVCIALTINRKRKSGMPILVETRIPRSTHARRKKSCTFSLRHRRYVLRWS
jgi:hypothetical protein